MKSHEMIYVFSKKGCYYKRIDVESDKGAYKGHSRLYDVKPGDTYSFVSSGGCQNKGQSESKRCPLSVINIKGKHRKGGHPTEKPMAVYTWLLSRYCPDGGTVLDPTAGSFNSIMAAEELGCIGIGIEMDETFFTAAVERHASLHDMD
jgi:DNA modification methylase